MSVNDAETLRDFALVLKIAPSIVAPPPESALRAAQIDIAKCYFSNRWLNSSSLEELHEHWGEDYKSIPLFLLLLYVDGHAQMSINYAAYELLKDGRFHGHLERLPRELDHWRDQEFAFAFELEPGFDAIPMIQVDPSLRFLVVARDRPCGRRDHLWLEWKNKLTLTPAKIRDKWNGMPQSERHRISPKSPDQISDGEPGRDTVKKALINATEELKLAGIPVD
jgi:hypothetical protein